MKKTLILLALLSLTGCDTFQKVGETAHQAVTEVQDAHTPEEWATFYEVTETVSAKGAEIARTRTGRRVFNALNEAARGRAEHWREQ